MQLQRLRADWRNGRPSKLMGCEAGFLLETCSALQSGASSRPELQQAFEALEEVPDS